MTLKDETGAVNFCSWEIVFQTLFFLALTVKFLGITSKLQVQRGILDLVAEKRQTFVPAKPWMSAIYRITILMGVLIHWLTVRGPGSGELGYWKTV